MPFGTPKLRNPSASWDDSRRPSVVKSCTKTYPFELACGQYRRSLRGQINAIATLAAVGFAGLLVVILRSEEVRGFLLNLIRSALSLP
ncbi:ABC-type spermidine/putrescine transport system permease subunit II [Arthrobacter sp. GAS37]